MIRFTYYLGFIVKCFSSMGQCIIPRILRRIQNTVKCLWWIFLWKYLNVFSYLILRKALITYLTGFWTYHWNIPIPRISFWRWYGLMAFNKGLNEYQSLEKLIYCWIIYFQCWIITFNVRGHWKKVSFYINKTSIFELMPKSVKSKHRTKTDKTELYDYFYSIKKARNEMTGACVLPLVNT